MSEYPVNVFFYGSYMNFAVLKEVDIDERDFTVGSVSGFALTISPLANLIRQTQGVVYGILTALTHMELERLYQEHARGKLGGHYLPEAVVVSLPNEIHTPALCYISYDMKSGKAEPAYVDRILVPARNYGFPAWYLDTIESFR